ncbi:MAG: hypothetical protein PHC88_05615 [Terrimicrobiaceae bacterium]|nr:hypothetical protein [Terrimicrobiaceae bacterium]
MAVFGLCALASCVGPLRRTAAPPVIEAERWSARQVSPDVYLVAIRNARGEQEALAYLCPKNSFVCTVEPVGRLVEIRRVRK